MSDEERLQPPKNKKIKFCSPTKADDVNIDDLITKCALSHNNSVMDERSENLSELEVTINNASETDCYEMIKVCESEECLPITSEHSEQSEKSFCISFKQSNTAEETLCSVIDRIIEGTASPYDSSVEWPHMYMVQNKKTIELSKGQVEDFIREKAVLLILQNDLGRTDCKYKSQIEELKHWRKKCEKIKTRLNHLQKTVDTLHIKSPQKVYKVRNVGIAVDK